MSPIEEMMLRHTQNELLGMCGHGPHAAGLIHNGGYDVPLSQDQCSHYDELTAFCRDHVAVVFRPIPGKGLVLRCRDGESASLAALTL